MATLKPTAREVQRQFIAHMPIIMGRIVDRCWTDDIRQNALCWAWYRFQQVYGHQTQSPELAAADAAHYATGQKRFRTFGRTPRHSSYIDAMEGAEPLAVDVAERSRREDQEESRPHVDIAMMPLRLRIVALPLAAGCSKAETARRTGIPLRTVHRRCAEIADWIVGRTTGAGRRVAA